MSDIGEIIKKKLEKYPTDVAALALAAIQASESGMPEGSVTDLLENVVRQIIRARGVDE